MNCNDALTPLGGVKYRSLKQSAKESSHLNGGYFLAEHFSEQKDVVVIPLGRVGISRGQSITKVLFRTFGMLKSYFAICVQNLGCSLQVRFEYFAPAFAQNWTWASSQSLLQKASLCGSGQSIRRAGSALRPE
jgi:hypothetical protein